MGKIYLRTPRIRKSDLVDRVFRNPYIHIFFLSFFIIPPFLSITYFHSYSEIEKEFSFCTMKFGISKVGIAKIGTAKVGIAKIGKTKIGIAKIGIAKIFQNFN